LFINRSLAMRLISLVALFAAWEIAGQIPVSFALPPFSRVMAGLFEMTLDGSLVSAYASTLQALVLGVVISAVFGVALGVGLGISRMAEWWVVPIFIVLYAAPMAALIPLVTFLYGIGLTSKTIAVCLLAMPVIVLNGYKAVRNVNASLVMMSQSFLATPIQRIFKVIIPDATPVIFAGLRLGVAGGFIGVVLAEFLITPTGIGDLITYNQSVAEYSLMYAAIVSIMILSTVTLSMLQIVETRFLRPERRPR
jgi:NitT/TauT family transport system permease protein